MVRFRCRECNYVHSPKVKERIPTRCPYCSETGTMMEERSILDDAGIDDLEE